MAHRKQIKTQPVPVRCATCKEKNAYHTAHGSESYKYGGKPICNMCWDEQRAADREYAARYHDGGELAQLSIDSILAGKSYT